MSKGKRVLIVGVGGLGSPVALALADSNSVSRLTLIDADHTELSNLHRQLLLREGDLGCKKVVAAANTLRARRPRARARTRGEGLEIVTHQHKLGVENVTRLFRDHDLVIEGSDDIHTKFLVNDHAVTTRVPAVIGGVVRFSGQVMTVLSGQPCYRCLFENPPEPGQARSCQQDGVLGPACGIVAGFMVMAARRLLEDPSAVTSEGLLTVDLLSWQTRKVTFSRRAECRACAARASQILDSGEAHP